MTLEYFSTKASIDLWLLMEADFTSIGITFDFEVSKKSISK